MADLVYYHFYLLRSEFNRYITMCKAIGHAFIVSKRSHMKLSYFGTHAMIAEYVRGLKLSILGFLY